MVCAELSSVPTVKPRISSGTKNPTSDLIPTKGTDVLPTAGKRHLVERFEYSLQKDWAPSTALCGPQLTTTHQKMPTVLHVSANSYKLKKKERLHNAVLNLTKSVVCKES